MSELLPLKKQITYGPVRSRRLGRSLGINLLPPTRKWCTFDCVYCQYGWTPAGGDPARKEIPSVEEVVRAVETAMQAFPEPPAYLTFSGNGEPTLHPDFPRIVEAVIALRDRSAVEVKIALLSNASRIGDPGIRLAISRLDRAILKFDAGSEQVFRSYNRPASGVEFESIVAGLAKMGKTTLQSLFTSGALGNLQTDHIDAWIGQIRKLRPQEVQIYTLSRPFPCQGITPAPHAALLHICNRLRGEGIPADVF